MQCFPKWARPSAAGLNVSTHSRAPGLQLQRPWAEFPRQLLTSPAPIPAHLLFHCPWSSRARNRKHFGGSFSKPVSSPLLPKLYPPEHFLPYWEAKKILPQALKSQTMVLEYGTAKCPAPYLRLNPSSAFYYLRGVGTCFNHSMPQSPPLVKWVCQSLCHLPPKHEMNLS